VEAPCKRARLGEEPDSAAWEEADVEIEIEGTIIKVHSIILAIASPIFAAMLRSSMKEGLNKKISLPGKSKEEFLLFMAHLRPGSTKRVTCDTVDKLLPWFDHFQVLDKKAECANVLMGCPVTARRLLQADKHGLKEQYRRCVNTLTPTEFVSEYTVFMKYPTVVKDLLPALGHKVKQPHHSFGDLACFVRLLQQCIAKEVDMSGQASPLLELCAQQAPLLDEDLCAQLVEAFENPSGNLKIVKSMLSMLLDKKSKEIALKDQLRTQALQLADHLYSILPTHNRIAHEAVLNYAWEQSL